MNEFSEKVRVATSPLIFSDRDLLPEERALAERAVEKRKREVAAGRVLARRVLKELGCPEAPLLNRADRVPLWPAGVVGSISHTDDFCVAVASRELSAIGVDVEMATPLESHLFSIVLVANEARWLALQPASERGLYAKLIFSAKECAYKAQYTFTQKMLEFSEVELELDLARRAWRASVLPDSPGFFVIDDRHILTGVECARG